MQYREDRVSGNKLSILGLGCMRFSRDATETERMILAAVEGGVNYFDTAYIYPNSEGLKQVAKRMEPLPVRLGIAVVRRFF
jgi:aryl-alcohol dehydrogenase-like predicted oxidoreductase